jgi:two-component system sensor histidine kinase HydH
VRLIVLSLVLVSFTAALTGSLAFVHARRALEKETRRRLDVAARSLAEHLHREIENLASELSSWARLDLMRALLYGDVDKQLAEFVDHMLRDRPLVHALACLDTAGAVVASAGRIPAASTALSEVPRLSLIEEPATGRPLLRLTIPVPHPDRPGATAGWLVAFVDPRRLLGSMAHLTPPAGRDVGLTLRADDGRELAQSGAAVELADGEAVSGVARIAPFPAVGAPELFVSVTESRATALEPLQRARAALWNIVILVLIVGSSLGGLMAWRIAAPIRQLTAAACAISERGHPGGELRLPDAPGEVGVLSRAFRQMLESLDAAQAQAVIQARRAFLGEVAANVAHEVRTPLSVLKTSAQLIARAGLPLAERERLAANVSAEVDRLNGVVTELVDLARPRPVRYRAESLPDIIGRALAFFAAAAGQSGVRIHYQRPVGGCEVNGSADQLYQVLLNLMQNALQAIGGPGDVWLTCTPGGRWVTVECCDSGAGIRADLLGRVFEPFCTGRSDGAGLGLSITRRIVEEHGGQIAAANRPGGGACLTIRLPRIVRDA